MVVLDDLSTGLIERIPSGVALEQVSLTDTAKVAEVFDRHSISGVLHLAAKKQVGESVERPDYYWEQNVGGLKNLLAAMAAHQIKRFIFSSSAAVYGQPDLSNRDLITENTPCVPMSPYGETKLEGEKLARAYSQENQATVIALRYFNVAGAGSPQLGDIFELNLIPIVLSLATKGKTSEIFGDDYPTHDGTCVRDYVHVQDVADAHVAAMDLVENSDERFEIANIGTGSGASVKEVIAALRTASGLEIPAQVVARRPGDPAELVASVKHAHEVLHWQSQYTLHDIADSAWRAWTK